MSNDMHKSVKRLRLIVDLDRPVKGFEDTRSYHTFDKDDSFLLLVDWSATIKELRQLIDEYYSQWYPIRSTLTEDYRLKHSITGADLFDQNASLYEIFDDWGSGPFVPRIYIQNKKRDRDGGAMEGSHQAKKRKTQETTPVKKGNTPNTSNKEQPTVTSQQKKGKQVTLPTVANNKTKEVVREEHKDTPKEAPTKPHEPVAKVTASTEVTRLKRRKKEKKLNMVIESEPVPEPVVEELQSPTQKSLKTKAKKTKTKVLPVVNSTPTVKPIDTPQPVEDVIESPTAAKKTKKAKKTQVKPKIDVKAESESEESSVEEPSNPVQESGSKAEVISESDQEGSDEENSGNESQPTADNNGDDSDERSDEGSDESDEESEEDLQQVLSLLTKKDVMKTPSTVDSTPRSSDFPGFKNRTKDMFSTPPPAFQKQDKKPKTVRTDPLKKKRGVTKE